LFLAGTLTGQKNGSAQVAWFRTFDPVDMHGLVHSGGQFAGRHGVFSQVWQCSAGLAIAGRVEVAGWAGMAMSPESVIFFLSSQESSESIQLLWSESASWPGVSPTEVDIFFSARRLKRNASSGLQPKACIQNSGNS
jgi:hypothetical protein